MTETGEDSGSLYASIVEVGEHLPVLVVDRLAVSRRDVVFRVFFESMIKMSGKYLATYISRLTRMHLRRMQSLADTAP